MRIKLSQLRFIIREEAARALAEAIDPKKTLYPGSKDSYDAAAQRDAALRAAGMKTGGVPVTTPVAPQKPKNANPLMNTMTGNDRKADDERDVALRDAGLMEDDAELDEMTESILRIIVSRASRRR